MVMRPRHALVAAALLAAVTLGSWAALSTDNPKPAPLAASEDAPFNAPPATTPRGPGVTSPGRAGPRPARMVRWSGRGGRGSSPRIAGDFDGDHARDQLLAYAELDAAGQPSRWHVRAELATGRVADLALDTNSVGPQRAGGAAPGGRRQRGRPRRGVRHLHRRRLRRRLQRVRAGRLPAPAASASTGALGPADPGRCLRGPCRRVRLPAHRPARPALAQPLGHRADAEDHHDGRSTYGWTRTSYRWAARPLVHPAGTTSGTFVAAPEDPPPAEFTTRCGAGSW